MIYSEWFWSKASAERHAANLARKHPGVYNCKIRYAMRADGSHDWLVEVF